MQLGCHRIYAIMWCWKLMTILEWMCVSFKHYNSPPMWPHWPALDSTQDFYTTVFTLPVYCSAYTEIQADVKSWSKLWSFGSRNRHPHPGDPTKVDQASACIQVAFYYPHWSPLFSQSLLDQGCQTFIPGDISIMVALKGLVRLKILYILKIYT